MKLFVTFTDKESLYMLKENIERLPESELKNCQILLIDYDGIDNNCNGMVVSSLNLPYAIFYVHKNKDDRFMIKNYFYYAEDENTSVSKLFWNLFTIGCRNISFLKLFKKYIDSCYDDCNNSTTFDRIELFALFSKCYDDIENNTDIRDIRDIIYYIIANLCLYPVFLYKDSEQWDYSILYGSKEHKLARIKCNHIENDDRYLFNTHIKIKAKYYDDIRRIYQ